MSLTWIPPQALPSTREDEVPDGRLPLYISMPVIFGVSALLWGGIGVAVAWLIG